MYRGELAEILEARLKTIKNKLSDLRKPGKVEDTGEVRGQSQQVRLACSPSLSVPGVPNPIGDRNGHTPRTIANEIYEAACGSCGKYTEFRKEGNLEECLNCGALLDFSRLHMTSNRLRAERNSV